MQAGYLAFCREFPDGGEYQAVLDACTENDEVSHARWLLNAFGKTTDIKEIDGDYISEKSIIVCGSLKVSGKIECKGYVQAGCGIEAGYGIEAGCGIEAGYGIEAGWGIEAGDGIKAGASFGIYAGLSERVTNYEYRTVKAKSKPDNLMCGEFVEVEENNAN